MAARAVDGMSLDRFMAKHTSEDNASFAEIMVESNKRRRLSKPWLFEQKDKVKPIYDNWPLAMNDDVDIFTILHAQEDQECILCDKEVFLRYI